MKKRLQAGFTLGETLVTVALLGIVFSSLTGGLIAASRVYRDVTEKANAQVLLSTAIMEVTNDLKNADASTYSTTDYSFTTSARGYSIRYTNDATNGLTAEPYPNTDDKMQSIPLVTKKAGTENLTVNIEDGSAGLTYDSTNKVFKCTIVIYGTSGELESQQIYVKPNE